MLRLPLGIATQSAFALGLQSCASTSTALPETSHPPPSEMHAAAATSGPPRRNFSEACEHSMSLQAPPRRGGGNEVRNTRFSPAPSAEGRGGTCHT